MRLNVAKSFFVAAAAFSSVLTAPAAAQPRLDLVGHPPDTLSRVTGLSYDGRAASGWIDPFHSGSSVTPGFRWERDVGRVDFPVESPAYGISGNSAVVVGTSVISSKTQGYRRLANGTIQGLGVLGGYDTGGASATNFDGSVVVGTCGVADSPINEPFRWTPSTGIRKLTGSPGGYGQANGVSDDGNIVVGTIDPGSVLNPRRAFVWTEANRFTYLTDAIGEIDGPGAWAVSGNGRFVVGEGGQSDAGGLFTGATLWDNGVPLGLGRLPGSSFTRALDVSDDGSVVIGPADNASNSFIWTPGLGMVKARTYLENNGVVFPSDLPFMTLTCVSGDGLSFGGTLGSNTDSIGFVVTIPEPGSVMLLVSLLGLSHRRYRSR